MKTLTSYIDENRGKIEHRIKKTISERGKNSLQIPLYNDALVKLSDFATTGKMMRGILVLASAEMFGKNPKKVLDISAAIELAHSGLLIHDDIIDDDELRRGKKTIFAQYAEGQTKFYGTSMATCAGDIAFFLSTELIAAADIPNAAKNKIISYFARELTSVGAAEMEDFHFGATDDEPTVEKILNMYKLKSARYTFSLPFVIGALVAGKEAQTINLLEKLGEKMGIVFQIVDDALGITGDTKITGKPVGNDIKQNKKTVVRKMLYEKANLTQKKTLDSIFGKKKISANDVKKIIDLADKIGVEKRINHLVEELSSEARKILAKLDISPKYKDLLSELIEYNLHRNK